MPDRQNESGIPGDTFHWRSREGATGLVDNTNRYYCNWNRIGLNT